MKIDKDSMKLRNRNLVLNLLRKDGAHSRTDISRKTGLGLSTVTNISEELISNNWIYEVGEQESTGGRRAKNVVFNKKRLLALGVKIEEERILVALTDLSGEVISKTKEAFVKGAEPQKVLNLVENTIENILTDEKVNLAQLIGIGVSSSGLINREEGILVKSTMLGWEDVHVVQHLKMKFPETAIFLDKNINAFTFAQIEMDGEQDTKNFLCVSIGAGLGLSIVINHKIHYGATGGAGEYGHTTIQVHGYACHCGQHGCLEMYASEFYFKNRAEELRRNYPKSTLNSFTQDEVFELAAAGEPLALTLVNEMSEYLSYGIRNLINTFNPEKIVLAGEAVGYSDLFIDKMHQICRKNFFEDNQQIEIKTSNLKESSWVQGAALIPINNFFEGIGG